MLRVLLLVAIIILQSGCCRVSILGIKFSTYTTAVVADKKLVPGKNVKLMDPNNSPIFFKEISGKDGQRTHKLSGDFSVLDINLPDIAHAKYHEEYESHNYIVVESKMKNGKILPLIFDTGNNFGFPVVQDIHILENDLPIYQMTKEQGPESRMSLCIVDQLTFGDCQLYNYPGICWGQHTETKLLGFVPVERSNFISFPLLLMSKFKYFKFDNIRKEALFSVKKSFKPTNEEDWCQFPLYIKNDDSDPDKSYLFTEITLNGVTFKPLLDTGSGSGLIMDEHLWKNVKNNFDETARKNVRITLPLYFEDNNPVCTRITVKKLQLGKFDIHEGKIIILPENKSWEKSDCLLGMEYFCDKVIVLDFEKSRLWVKFDVEK